MRALILAYGLLCYLIFFGVFLYAIGFIGGYLVPKDINDGPETAFGIALAVNVALLGVFGLQHSIMARPSFKKAFTKIVPQPAERATYVLASSLILVVLFWLWRPMTGVIWDARGTALEWPLRILYFGGWGLVLYATALIDHFDLFGVRQVVLYFQGKEYTHRPFQTPALYKHVRHPLYIGWFTVFWMTPLMTVGHLVFAAVASAYIVVATYLEEHDLVRHFGDPYAQYQKTTPKFIPIPKRTKEEPPPTEPVGK
jgi:protein-S-isoprenylcysteine O-methyltransferase Ste14